MHRNPPISIAIFFVPSILFTRNLVVLWNLHIFIPWTDTHSHYPPLQNRLMVYLYLDIFTNISFNLSFQTVPFSKFKIITWTNMSCSKKKISSYHILYKICEIVEKIMINDTIFQYRIVKLSIKLLVKKVFCIYFLNPSSCFDFKKNGFGKWIFRSQVICMNVYHQMILCAYFIYCNPLFLHYSFLWA